MSLYIKHRPTGLKDVIGQDQAVRTLVNKIGKDMPHTILFSGPTGCGKTTIARILGSQLDCTETNLTETNCADVRGIDSVREIKDVMHLAPMGGKSRVWILDEVVQLPKATQQAFLKILEDTPRHVYFLLCTSDLTGLLPTFIGRCFHLALRPLGPADIQKVLLTVCEKEKKMINASLVGEITENCNGSARAALQLLETALVWDKLADQIKAVQGTKITEESEFLGKALFGNITWDAIAKLIDKLEHKDIESVRYATLAYASKMLAFSQQKGRAMKVIYYFKDSFQWCGKAGMMLAAYLTKFATESERKML